LRFRLENCHVVIGNLVVNQSLGSILFVPAGSGNRAPFLVVGSGPAEELNRIVGLAKFGISEVPILIAKLTHNQMVSESASANLRATKMVFDMMKEVEQKTGAAAPEPAKLTAPDREVVELFVARLRRQIAAEAAEPAEASAAAASEQPA
jgi:hypothetical protein